MSIKLRISITAEVLEATKDCGSKPGQLIVTSCAIAYAIRGIWPDAVTGYEDIDPFCDGNHIIIHHQQKFLSAFDTSTPAERARMQPFSFDIEVPDEVISEVNIEEIRRICEGSKTLELMM